MSQEWHGEHDEQPEQPARLAWRKLAESEVRKGVDQVADVTPQADPISPQEAMARVEPRPQGAELNPPDGKQQ